MAKQQTPSDIVAARVRQLRTGRGLKVRELAARCAELGVPGLTTQALYKLEGRPADRPPRPVTVDELLVLAVALNVSVRDLIVPPYPPPPSFWGDRPPDGPNMPNDEDPYPVTPELAAPCWEVRQFICGESVLPGMDIWDYLHEAPPNKRPSDEQIQKLVDNPLNKRWMTGG